jgi:hypothetical protein
MEMISILLLDGDRSYANRLAQRLAAADRGFSVTVGAPASDGTAAYGLNAGSPTGETYDFVLTDESGAAARADGARDFGGAREVVLSESAQTPTAVADEKTPNARGSLRANRYGRVSSLVALLRAEYATRPGEGGFSRNLAGGAVKCIGCFGLGGGCGASSVAIGIGRDFAAYKDRRTLYVSLETLEATELCIRAAEGEKHIGDFMYLMLRGREADLRLFSESCLYRDSYGLARFYPSPGLNDLARASPEECGDFLRFMGGCGAFDLIVLDLGGECKELILKAARLCDALVLVSNGSLADTGKRARAAALLREAWGREGADPVFAENLLPQLCDFDGTESATETAPDPAPDAAGAKDRIAIHGDEASFRHFDGMTDFVLSNEFGLGIRRLTDRLFERICE